MPTNTKYRDSALLSHARNKTNDKAPDYYGEIEFSEETIRFLATQVKAGDEPKLRVALWRKSNDRGTYLSIKLDQPREGAGRSSPSSRDDRGRDDREIRDVRDDRDDRPTRRDRDRDDDGEIPF